MAATRRDSSERHAAFQDAIDAMTEWQEEARAMSERHGKEVLDKLGSAAKAAGWPDTLVDASRDQIKLMVDAQSQAIDQMMSTWQHQLDSPGMHVSTGFGHSMPAFADPAAIAANPAQFWMQLATSWQKSWLEAMQAWTPGPRKDRH